VYDIYSRLSCQTLIQYLPKPQIFISNAAGTIDRCLGRFLGCNYGIGRVCPTYKYLVPEQGNQPVDIGRRHQQKRRPYGSGQDPDRVRLQFLFRQGFARRSSEGGPFGDQQVHLAKPSEHPSNNRTRSVDGPLFFTRWKERRPAAKQSQSLHSLELLDNRTRSHLARSLPANLTRRKDFLP
jgi:hypothetical protein